MERAKEKGKVVQRDIERGGRERVREEKQMKGETHGRFTISHDKGAMYEREKKNERKWRKLKQTNPSHG